MKNIRLNYEKGLINSTKLNRMFGAENVDDLLHDVETYVRDLNEDLVFSHGDYSMPNILISNSRVILICFIVPRVLKI